MFLIFFPLFDINSPCLDNPRFYVPRWPSALCHWWRNTAAPGIFVKGDSPFFRVAMEWQRCWCYENPGNLMCRWWNLMTSDGILECCWWNLMKILELPNFADFIKPHFFVLLIKRLFWPAASARCCARARRCPEWTFSWKLCLRHNPGEWVWMHSDMQQTATIKYII